MLGAGLVFAHCTTGQATAGEPTEGGGSVLHAATCVALLEEEGRGAETLLEVRGKGG